MALRKTSVEVGNAGWIVIFPLRPPSAGFNVRSFEVEESLLADESDIWDGVMANLSDTRVETIEDAEALVVELGENPDELDAPWHVDCPI